MSERGGCGGCIGLVLMGMALAVSGGLILSWLVTGSYLYLLAAGGFVMLGLAIAYGTGNG